MSEQYTPQQLLCRQQMIQQLQRQSLWGQKVSQQMQSLLVR